MKKVMIIVAAFVVAVGAVIGFGMTKKSADAASRSMIKIGGVFEYLRRCVSLW